MKERRKEMAEEENKWATRDIIWKRYNKKGNNRRKFKNKDKKEKESKKRFKEKKKREIIKGKRWTKRQQRERGRDK